MGVNLVDLLSYLTFYELQSLYISLVPEAGFFFFFSYSSLLRDNTGITIFLSK